MPGEDVQGPEHEGELNPVVFPNTPEGQILGTEAPRGQKKPWGQGVGFSDDKGQKDPLGQRTGSPEEQ